jgi:hypothetical protein
MPESASEALGALVAGLERDIDDLALGGRQLKRGPA